MTTVALNALPDWSTYIHQRKPLWNAIALTYTLAGYIGGVALLLAANLWLNALGVVLVTHTLVLSAYLAHEFMHGTIFSRMKSNTAWGGVMQWLHGTSYFPFRKLAQYHIDHHIEGVDFYAFDRTALLQSLPNAVQAIIVVLEWLYFPATFIISQFQSITAPFWQADRQDERLRVATVLGLRILMFACLGWLSLKALVLYCFCYIGMVNIVRLMDCLQHTYVAYPAGASVSKKDPAYERENTFSTPLSRRYPKLNLLLLNFGYHSAHHAVMKCPWYNLPELDRAIAQKQPVHHIGLFQVVANYHRFRIQRVFSKDEGVATVDAQGNLQLSEFYGVSGGTSIHL
jgi:fatty acid desaturase